MACISKSIVAPKKRTLTLNWSNWGVITGEVVGEAVGEVVGVEEGADEGEVVGVEEGETVGPSVGKLTHIIEPVLFAIIPIGQGSQSMPPCSDWK